MGRRKTIEVREVISHINRFIACNQEGRKQLCQLADKILHDTQNYQGFQYSGGHKPDASDFDQYNRVYNLPR